MAELRPSGAPGPTAPPAPGPTAPPAFASLFPPGLHAIYGECRRLYPDQPNPLQVTAIVKYWLGGPDPLDYVSMYRNVGSPSANIPEHWHYISFGLSDLYGDNRVHEFTGTDGPSGFGFELTFRLKRETGESAPPTWPAELMQGLARYVFQSENTFCSGDHVSWHSPLDNSESRIQHMLLTEDPQMQPVQTPFGVVTFLQIVGVCTEELHAAQQWNGQGILELLRTVPIAGGPWLITDMRRGETIFEIDPHLQAPDSVSEMEKNLHPEFLAKQVSNAARGSPALLLSGDSSLCDHTLCCWKRKLQVWSRRNWAESPPLPPVAGFHPGLWSSDGVISEERKDCAFPQEGGSWLCHISSTGQHRVGRVGALKRERVDKGIETDGSNLSGVSAKCAWDDLSRPPEDDEDSRSICIGTQPRRLSGKDTEQIRETLRRGLEINSKPVLPPINPQRQNGLTHDRAPSRKDSLESDSSTAIIPHELIRTRQLESVHLKFNQESGALIPLCLRGRLLHGRHFTYKSITGDMAITFVSTGVEGAFATEEHPYAAHGPWLQILLTEEFVEKMLEDLEDLTSPEEFKLPKEYSWPEKKLKVSILPDVVFDSPLH
ncbi:suppressor of fused homolog isoform X2 [Balaenoptera ricei]|uniref:suppressor of fused homolog isoform X2 n=1 Tax=Balaenoptera ricei TaxID=2746895 RepID=UPI0028BEC021|nr:suppressor of fused homolog isoform X2 [Balaenoptera ricei]